MMSRVQKEDSEGVEVGFSGGFKVGVQERI